MSRPISSAPLPDACRERTIANHETSAYTLIKACGRAGAPFLPGQRARNRSRFGKPIGGDHDGLQLVHPQTIILATLVVGFGCAQYMLAVHAMRDLVRRPRVRGGNKVSWGLAILCLPIAGALIYGWMGPASFIRRAPGASTVSTAGESGTTLAQSVQKPPAAEQARAPHGTPEPLRNITPIRRTRLPTIQEHPVPPSPTAPGRIRRTGS